MPEIHDVDGIITKFVVNLVVIQYHLSNFPRFISNLLYADCWVRLKASTAGYKEVQDIISMLSAVLKSKTVDAFQVILSFKPSSKFPFISFSLNDYQIQQGPSDLLHARHLHRQDQPECSDDAVPFQPA